MDADVVPSILYRYREFSYRNLALLLNHAVYIPAARQLNDPFDCGVRLSRRQIPPDQFRRLFDASIDGVEDQRKRAAEINGIDAGVVAGRYTPAFTAYIDKVAGHMEKEAANVGIVSLSEIPDSTTMWSHYAGGHTGYCVGYATKKMFPKLGDDSLHKVRYVAKNDLAINAYELYAATCGTKNSDVYQSRLNAMFATKLDDWEYEKEWRFLSPNVSQCTRELPQESIKSIHFGLRSAAVDRIALRNLLADHAMVFYRMRVDADGTGLVSVPLGKDAKEWTEPEQFD
jgi:hypothetical protein